jgi:hypothetical protein
VALTLLLFRPAFSNESLRAPPMMPSEEVRRELLRTP